MLMTDVSLSGSDKDFIEFGTRLNFMSPTKHIGHQYHILAYYDIGDRLEIPPTCRKISPIHFFVTSILKWSPSLCHQHHCQRHITRALILSKSKIAHRISKNYARKL